VSAEPLEDLTFRPLARNDGLEIKFGGFAASLTSDVVALRQTANAKADRQPGFVDRWDSDLDGQAFQLRIDILCVLGDIPGTARVRARFGRETGNVSLAVCHAPASYAL
jgi:hypothetical protein